MKQEELIAEVPEIGKLDTLSREHLIERLLLTHSTAVYQSEQIKVLMKAVMGKEAEERLAFKDMLLIIRRRLFGKSSEKRPKAVKKRPGMSGHEKRREEKKRLKLPSMRYPELPLEECEIEIDSKSGKPECELCSSQMEKMNQTEDGEYLTVTEKVYTVVRQKRQKYCCKKCHGAIYTAPAPPKIVKGGAFSDKIAIDVAVGKYADHLPIERYVNQAERAGLLGIKPQSLIEQTHSLADFLEKPVYEKLKGNIEQAFYLHADETRWRMLEGDETQGWQLWGFFDAKNAYYEARDTRAAVVAKDFLKTCGATYLVSDAYQGYGKCAREVGKKNCFCNAHARRKWREAEESFLAEAEPVVELYEKIYAIEAEIKGKSAKEKYQVRQIRVKPLVEEIKKYCINLYCLPKSSLGKARIYFLKYYDELTAFLEDGRLPIDNNHAERGLRGPVLGRKNFYGNHSKRGAKTTSILYSIIESCKLNKIDSQKYLRSVVHAIHYGNEVLTPVEWAGQKQ